MADEFGARNDGTYMVICTMPDVCKILNMTPTPFPITETLANSTKYSKKTRFNGKFVILLNSHTTKVTGDELGVNLGVSSQTDMEKAESIDHSKSFKVEGDWVVRVGDKFYMNSQNTQGKLVFAPAPQESAIKDNGAIHV